MISSFNYAKEQPKGITLTKENDGYKVDFVLPDYYMNNVTAAGNNYINLTIPEYGEPTDVGLPNLPQISFSLMIAYDEQMPTINVLNQIKDLQILSNKIYPVQQPWPKNLRLEDRPFTIDTRYYQSTGNINGPFVKISEPFIIAGVKGVMVTVCPFNYNPSANQMMVTKTGSFKIQLKSQPVMSFAPTSSFNKLYDGMFLNYVSSKAVGTGRYLIITAPAYESGLTPLVNEKTGLGYIVSVVNTTVTGTTNTAILAYIQNLYNNVSTRPEFVLLVGDVDVIPEWVGIGEGTPHTDLNYSMLDGTDPYADVFLGRFPVANTTQLSNMITKTLYMENAINGLPKKNIFCASTDNYAITEATHNFCIDSFFVPSVYTNLKLYTHTYSATTQQLIDALNANQTFAIYSGHGSETSWADGPPLNASQVNALTNTVFPYTYSFSCLTGSYYLSYECFSETWVRGQKGAVVYWGSSVNSYWTEDDILQKRIFRAMFIEK
ncbi:MAG: C25 family cysteine peptidase [Ignavibacteriae bacterium]|nr:C25 family cysteine peptidase [Ignavibacteriota bacterium]